MAYYEPSDTMRSHALTPLSQETVERVHRIKAAAQDLYDDLAALPQSADMTLAKRKVEEAVMWAVKAITA